MLEAQLAEHGLTLRYYPQSFELSTLGGWIATRAGGHFATGETHVDDLVESVRAITPAGTWESRRLPGSGAGPSPDRLLLGSEGTLGVITEAWVRVRPRPRQRAGRACAFRRFARRRRRRARGRAVRAAARELPAARPARGARRPGAGRRRQARARARLRVRRQPVDHELEQALARCREHGGEPDEPRRRRGGGAAPGARRSCARPTCATCSCALGVLSETFETAITWERFGAFHEAVIGATRAALGEPRRVTCRFTHVYPDGPAPYFTVLAPARRGDEVAQWDAIKRAAADAVLAAGGTITHHHAVGRDHRPWYDAQRPEPFAAALRAAKGAVDPAGLLNPGVLVDP